MMCRNNAPQPEGLISVLLNSDAEFGDRHDAAMDLSEFDGEAVESALEQIIADKTEDSDLVEECEQSLLDVRRRQN
jgi:hypothetical protein